MTAHSDDASAVCMAIEANAISRRDPRAADGWLLRDVSVSVNPGDRLGIVGPSGAGKTVLLRNRHARPA